MRHILVALTLLFTLNLMGQDYNIGVRAGLDFSTFRGPLEAGETLHYKNGFHFGLSYQYNFTDIVGLRAELLYKQVGGEKRYSGPSYYILRESTETTYDVGVIEEDGYLLRVSNGYVSIPVTMHYRINSKIEVHAGAYAAFLVSPTANGILNYTSTVDPDGIFFDQSLEYNYYSDEPLQGNSIVQPISLLLEGEEFLIPRIAGAYYQFAEDRGNGINTLDLGLIAGASYYFNGGFYTSFRAEFGLLDVTNNDTDASLISLDANNDFIFREDRDTNLNFQVSLGFKF